MIAYGHGTVLSRYQKRQIAVCINFCLFLHKTTRYISISVHIWILALYILFANQYCHPKCIVHEVYNASKYKTRGNRCLPCYQNVQLKISCLIVKLGWIASQYICNLSLDINLDIQCNKMIYYCVLKYANSGFLGLLITFTQAGNHVISQNGDV